MISQTDGGPGLDTLAFVLESIFQGNVPYFVIGIVMTVVFLQVVRGYIIYFLEWKEQKNIEKKKAEEKQKPKPIQVHLEDGYQQDKEGT